MSSMGKIADVFALGTPKAIRPSKLLTKAGLLPETPKPAPTPGAPPPTPMADEDTIRRAKDRARLEARARGGRTSTLLSQASGERLGG